MKKMMTIFSMLFVGIGVNGQTFTDDFESYAVGSYLGPQSTDWTTWSGTEGGAEDVQITNNQAYSGTNSIYFSSTAQNGGPQDVVLNFPQQYTDGAFVFEAYFYVEAGKGAYFNFQATPTIGQTWAMNCNMSGGNLIIDDGITANLATTTYQENTWFKLTIVSLLEYGRWEARIDNVCFGVWENGVNTVASLDIYPLNGHGFYVDDVSYTYTPIPPVTTNATITNVKIDGSIVGQQATPVVTVKNTGTAVLNDFDVVLDFNGNQYTENITGANLASGASTQVVFSSPITITSTTASVTLLNINGTGNSDDYPADNTACKLVNAVTPATGKIVVSEEGTGTWCGWCPRGAVAMDRFADNYAGYWAGIAVHNGDPMELTNYATPFGNLVSGYPSALVDRGASVDPAQMDNDFFTRLQIAPAAFMTNGATWDAATRELKVSVSANFQTSANDQYKMVCVLVEDSVTGTTSGYAQVNYYSGGSNGVMGGFESLPNPVPANQMVYNHVARAISPSFDGSNQCFTATVNPNDIITQNFVWTLPAEWDETKVHIVGMLIDPQGRIDNADYTTIDEAVQNGFVNACNLTVGEILGNQVDEVLRIYPNPATDLAKIVISLKEDADVQMRLLNVAGKEIAKSDYGMISSSTLDLNVSSLQPGIYFIELTVNGEKVAKRLVVE